MTGLTDRAEVCLVVRAPQALRLHVVDHARRGATDAAEAAVARQDPLSQAHPGRPIPALGHALPVAPGRVPVLRAPRLAPERPLRAARRQTPLQRGPGAHEGGVI